MPTKPKQRNRIRYFVAIHQRYTKRLPNLLFVYARTNRIKRQYKRQHFNYAINKYIFGGHFQFWNFTDATFLVISHLFCENYFQWDHCARFNAQTKLSLIMRNYWDKSNLICKCCWMGWMIRCMLLPNTLENER